MKQLAAFIGFAALCLILNAWAAEPLADFSGTWILDVKNSDPFLRPIRDLGATVPGGGVGGGMGGGMPGGMGGGMPRGGMPGGMGGGMPGGGMPGRGAGGMQPPDNPPLVIEQTESEVQIIRTTLAEGKQTPVVVSYKFDERERVEMMPVPNSPDPIKVVTKITWKKNKFEIRTASYLPQGKNEMKRNYSLSKDGKTLTVQTSNSTAMGELIQKQIYNKQ